MYRRDYIMRLIEQTAVTIRQVLLNKAGQGLQDRLLILNQAMKQLMGLDSKLVQALSVQDLLALLAQGGHPDLGKALGVSDILTAQSKVHRETGQMEESRSDSAKALELLLVVRGFEAAEGFRGEIDFRVEEALQLLDRVELHEGLWERLVHYYEETGRLAKAEDMLFHWLERLRLQGEAEPLTYVLMMGADMYDRWLRMDDAQLEEGGLTRDEVHQGKTDLDQMKA